MPHDRLGLLLEAHVSQLEAQGTAKGEEPIVREVLLPTQERGPRVLLEGHGPREFIRLNSNSYLGLAFLPQILRAEEDGVLTFGAGPGGVRFISGSYLPHRLLEERLAAFHGREDAVIFSSAYAAVLGALPPLLTPRTIVLSDELNHNSIINAMRMARPAEKIIYPHLDLAALDEGLRSRAGQGDRAVVVTDGIFSMRGDHAPLAEIMQIARRHDHRYPENVVVVVDDSHGVGAFGATGRGVEEHAAGLPADVLIGTLGKAFGVNGGYVVGTRVLARFLRETAATYIYSNPITAGEALAAYRAVGFVDSEAGRQRLGRLRELTRRFDAGVKALGIETIPSDHPVVPLMIRDTDRTRDMVQGLFEGGVLATGLTFPVVPRGDEEIRAQINADHTEEDLDFVLEALHQVW